MIDVGDDLGRGRLRARANLYYGATFGFSFNCSFFNLVGSKSMVHPPKC